MTHTVAELGLTANAYNEIRGKLEVAGYQHTFMEDGMIDMTGIGITREGDNAPIPPPPEDRPFNTGARPAPWALAALIIVLVVAVAIGIINR